MYDVTRIKAAIEFGKTLDDASPLWGFAEQYADPDMAKGLHQDVYDLFSIGPIPDARRIGKEAELIRSVGLFGLRIFGSGYDLPLSSLTSIGYFVQVDQALHDERVEGVVTPVAPQYAEAILGPYLSSYLSFNCPEIFRPLAMNLLRQQQGAEFQKLSVDQQEGLRKRMQVALSTVRELEHLAEDAAVEEVAELFKSVAPRLSPERLVQLSQAAQHLYGEVMHLSSILLNPEDD